MSSTFQAALSQTQDFTPSDDSQNNEPLIARHPEIKTNAMFGLAGEIVRAVCANSEADPAAVLITVLTFAGALFGGDKHFRVDSTRQPPRLLAIVVGASSRARKGTSVDPIKLIALRAAELSTDCELRISNGPLSSGEGVIFAVRDESEDQDENGKPVDPGVKDKRLMVIESEFGAVLKVLQRDGNTLSAILRTAWDHGNIEPLTKGKRIKATGAHLCAVGHITSLELRTLLSKNDIYNGLGNRLLWICARRQKLVTNPSGLSDAQVCDFAQKLANIVRASNDLPPRLEFSEEARLKWERIYPVISRDIPGIVGVITSRAEAQVIRLALIYALLDCSVKIDTHHLDAALALWHYCQHSARFIFGDEEPEQELNQVLLLLKTGPKTQTEINDAFGGHLSSQRLKGILEKLQQTGRVTQSKTGGGGKSKGRPKVTWQITRGFEAGIAELEEIAE